LYNQKEENLQKKWTAPGKLPGLEISCEPKPATGYPATLKKREKTIPLANRYGCKTGQSPAFHHRKDLIGVPAFYRF